MKHFPRLSLLLLVLIGLLTLAGCTTLPSMSGGLVIGDNFRLESGEVFDQDLTVIGGNAVLEQDSTVNGDVAVMGGSLSIDGLINGDVSVMGGSVRLDDHAVVRGAVSQLGGSVDKSESARVERMNDFDRPPFGGTIRRAPPFEINLNPIADVMWAIFQAFALAALAILVQLFAANPMERVGQAAERQPVITGAIGLLTLVVAPALLILLGITIILLPVSLLGILVAGIAWVFGWIALGLVTGRRLAGLFRQNWSDPVNAGVGTLTLSLVTSLVSIIPCVGWLAAFVVGIVGLGAVIVTRFGTRFYTGPSDAPAYPGPAPRPVPPYTPPPAAPAGPGARIFDRPESDLSDQGRDDIAPVGPSPEDPDRPQS